MKLISTTVVSRWSLLDFFSLCTLSGVIIVLSKFPFRSLVFETLTRWRVNKAMNNIEIIVVKLWGNVYIFIFMLKIA